MKTTARKILMALTCGAAMTCAASVPADILGNERLSLVWSQEFDGDSLDRAVWNVEYNGTGCGNHELQYYIDSPENVAVRDGNLVLTARRTPYDGHAFTSGRVNTHHKFTFTYGVVETRVKLPVTGDGLWPAVWFMGDDISENGWPFCGETDLLEMGHADGIADGSQDALFNGALHYGSDRHMQQVGARRSPYSLQDGEYHTFLLSWTPRAIEMYVDNNPEPYLNIDIDRHDDPSAPGYYFNKPFFMIVNLAVGGDFTGIHSPEGITALDESNDQQASMFIDYIRIYLPDNQLISQQ